MVWRELFACPEVARIQSAALGPLFLTQQVFNRSPDERYQADEKSSCGHLTAWRNHLNYEGHYSAHDSDDELHCPSCRALLTVRHAPILRELSTF